MDSDPRTRNGLDACPQNPKGAKVQHHIFRLTKTVRTAVEHTLLLPYQATATHVAPA